MEKVRLAHTSSLSDAELHEVRTLLIDGFEEHFDDHDWDHTLGGVHALIGEGGVLVAHGAVVQRRLLHAGRALRTGYVEGVVVRADRRGRGHGRAIMQAVGEVVRRAYDLGALSAGAEAARLYRSLDWERWQGHTWVLGPHGPERTPDEDGTTYVLRGAAPLDLAGELACDWREGDVW